MHLVIRNSNGDILSKVENVTISPVGCNTLTTRHGIFMIDEYAIDYVNDEINAYSTEFDIKREWHERYNEWGTYLN